ncbi:MAG: VWA domain-containing protein [Terriglobales bacterium]
MWLLNYLSSRRALARGLAFLVTFAFLFSATAIAQQAPSTSKPSQPAPAEAGGPQGDIGPYTVPKKKEEPPPEPKTTAPKKIEGMPDYSIKVDTALVQVPVSVVTKDGQFIPGLKADNFRVFEDGVPQRISNFELSKQAPITAVMVIEFAARAYRFVYDALNASYTFAQTLKPSDWVAVITFDIKPTILADFTQDKGRVMSALNSMRLPMFSETNLFDALYDTLDRVDAIEGRKYILLISSGCDTFSRTTYDQVLKKIKDTPNVTIFTVSTGEALRLWLEARGYGMQPSLFQCTDQMAFLQADNQMQTFARMTGGRWYKPRFEAEMKDIFGDIGQNIRNQYVIAYRPTNPKLDGTYRKLKVEVVAPDGGQMHIRNQKGKDVKYTVLSRDGYMAKHQVE